MGRSQLTTEAVADRATDILVATVLALHSPSGHLLNGHAIRISEATHRSARMIYRLAIIPLCVNQEPLPPRLLRQKGRNQIPPTLQLQLSRLIPLVWHLLTYSSQVQQDIRVYILSIYIVYCTTSTSLHAQQPLPLDPSQAILGRRLRLNILYLGVNFPNSASWPTTGKLHLE